MNDPDEFVLTTPPSALDLEEMALERMTPEELARLEKFELEVRVWGDPVARRFVELFDCTLLNVVDLRNAKKLNR
jgi:hypothetical protein